MISVYLVNIATSIDRLSFRKEKGKGDSRKTGICHESVKGDEYRPHYRAYPPKYVLEASMEPSANFITGHILLEDSREIGVFHRE